MHQYNACVAEGVHYILGKYDEGITFEKARRYALAPNSKNQTALRFTPIFDFNRPGGFWRSVVLAEIHQERKRQDINSLVAARGKPTYDRRRPEAGRMGGDEEKPKSIYPTGPNLTAVEKKSGYSHKPLGKNGVALCYNFSAHSGCS